MTEKPLDELAREMLEVAEGADRGPWRDNQVISAAGPYES